MPWDRVHDEAEVLEHVISEELEDADRRQARPPDRGPARRPDPDRRPRGRRRAPRRPAAGARAGRARALRPRVGRRPGDAALARRAVRAAGRRARGARQAALRRPADGPGRASARRTSLGGWHRRRDADTDSSEATEEYREGSRCAARCRTPRCPSPGCVQHGTRRPRREHGADLDRGGLPRARRTRRSASAPRGWPTRCASSASTATSASRPSSGTTRSTSRPTSRCPAMGAVLHTLNVRLFPEQVDLHRQPRRGQGRHLRPVAGRAAVASVLGEFETVEHVLVTGDDPDLVAARGQGRRGALLRGAARRRVRRVRLGRGRRARRRGHVLHERHDRQPEGRRLQPPLDRPALHGRLHGRRDGPARRRARCWSSCRSSTRWRGACPTRRCSSARR